MDGIHGMFAGRSATEERLFIERKKGLIRIALRTGTPLVPCYCFGQSKLVGSGQDPFGFMMWLSRTCKVSLVLPIGRWLLPIPFRTPCTLAIGRPIQVEKVPEGTQPDQQQVDELHALLVKETTALFERYKAACGFDAKEVRIK
eukprot:gnl/TRDRNA2_/TRDRNA2_141531_c0_seq2.p1 gnl/TRDRNA2_/TRDRNA2_141531_c0~~gnl/TRDRNA2_/TRDRNA2_141531_c0_seq2.p1  ORF type:complete len:164 (+),score=26.50 gnl/TRDRNA2_/TRDRNA2_141531_c0_seq2:63-494(+)